MTTRIAILMAGLALLLSVVRPDAALAVLPDEMLDDPALEARAREISSELRCVVCQNQSIDDSNAEIARDLRLLVRERLVAGDSNEEVVEYVVARYGDFVRLRPPFQENTLALWLGPPIMAIVIATLAVLFYRAWQHRRENDAGLHPLSPDDRAELDALVERIAATTPTAGPKTPFRAELDNPRPPPEREDERETSYDDARQDESTSRDEDTSAR